MGTRACLALVGAKGAHRSWWSCTVNRPILVPRNDVPGFGSEPIPFAGRGAQSKHHLVLDGPGWLK